MAPIERSRRFTDRWRKYGGGRGARMEPPLLGPPPGLAPSRYAPGPRPDPDMNQGPAHGTGPVWGQSCPQMSTGSQQSRSSQLKHRIRYPLHGSGRSGPENRPKVPARARARGMCRPVGAGQTQNTFWLGWRPEPRVGQFTVTVTGHPATNVAGSEAHAANALSVSQTSVQYVPSVQSGGIVITELVINARLLNSGPAAIRYCSLCITFNEL
jgi:hypothetical protein